MEIREVQDLVTMKRRREMRESERDAPDHRFHGVLATFGVQPGGAKSELQGWTDCKPFMPQQPVLFAEPATCSFEIFLYLHALGELAMKGAFGEKGIHSGL